MTETNTKQSPTIKESLELAAEMIKAERMKLKVSFGEMLEAKWRNAGNRGGK